MLVLGDFLLLGGLGSAPAGAAPVSLVASAGVSGDTCSQTAPYSLAQALAQANAGDTTLLVSPAATRYVGNWQVLTTGTSPSDPLTIKPAPGVSNPTLDGNGGRATGCTTAACNGPILNPELLLRSGR